MTFLHTCGCVSARPLISEVYFGRALVPTVPRTVSLCLHPTNCALSLNTPSAFNYCLRVLGSGVAHSVGSLRGSASVACVHVQLVRFNVQNVPYRERSIEGSAEFHRTPRLPLPLLITCHALLTCHEPCRNRFGSANGLQRCLCESTWNTSGLRLWASNLSAIQNAEIISQAIIIRHDMQMEPQKGAPALEVKAPLSPRLNCYFPWQKTRLAGCTKDRIAVSKIT